MFAFKKLEANGKLACPAPPVFGLIGTKKASKMIKAWDDFAMQPRRPSQELELPALEIFNTIKIEDALNTFDNLTEEEKSEDLLETLLAAALLETIPLPFGPLASVKSVAEVLIAQGDVKQDCSRAFIENEAAHLIECTKIGIDNADPWLKLSLWGRKVLERVWAWIQELNAETKAVPHDLLPFKFTRHFEDHVLPVRPEGAREFNAPPGHRMTGKINQNRTVICTSFDPFEVVVVSSKIKQEDLPKLAEKFSTILEAFAWDQNAYASLAAMLKAIEEGQSQAAIQHWKGFVEATKAIPKATGSTAILVVSKLAKNFLANSAAKNLGDLLLKTNQNRKNQAIIRFWRYRFGRQSFSVAPRKLNEVPTPAKVENRRLLLTPPEELAPRPMFKPREGQKYCAVVNCGAPLLDFFVCPLHHRVLVDKLKEDKIATIAPPDLADPLGAERVWAAEQTPMTDNDSHNRARYHLEAIALHNPDVGLELPVSQMGMTMVAYHTTGVDINWGSRAFWKNKELLRALQAVNDEFISKQFELKVIPDAVPPHQMDVPPMGGSLDWVVLPGSIDPRNNPQADMNKGADEDGLCWNSLVLTRDWQPSLGEYSSIGSQEDGVSMIFEITEKPSGERSVSTPVLSIVKKGRIFVVDPLNLREACPRECRRIFDKLDLTADSLTNQMKREGKKKIPLGDFFAFPELATLASFAETDTDVNFVATFESVDALQRAKNFLARWAKKNNHRAHPKITLLAVDIEPKKEHLPQAFFMYKQGQNYKFWRPVRPGMNRRFNAWPQSFDEKYEFRFIGHALAQTLYPGGVSSDNLLGLISEDLLPEITARRPELYRELELAVQMLALLVDLNDASALDKLNIVGGELAFITRWQRSFYFFKEDSDAIRAGQAEIREMQERSRQRLLDRHFREVLNVKSFPQWLVKCLEKDERFEKKVIEETQRSWYQLAQFPFPDTKVMNRIINDTFAPTARTWRDVKVLYEKPDPLPKLALRGMMHLQLKSTGAYSEVQAYENARKRMDDWLEAKHQRTLQNRRETEAEEVAEAQRERLRQVRQENARLAAEQSEEELSTDSELDSDEEVELHFGEAAVENIAEAIAARPAPQNAFVFDDWRANLPDRAQNPRPASPDDVNEDECPEPEANAGLELPGRIQIRPLTPEEVQAKQGFAQAGAPAPAQPEEPRPRRIVAQIVEDAEYRPEPDEQEAFECRHYFPHRRYDELFESGEADKFAEFARKTREGVRRLLEEDLEFVSHNRAFTKIEAVFNEVLEPLRTPSSLNLSESRNKPRRDEHPLPNEAESGENLAQDYELLNLGQQAKAVWQAGGEVIVPHRSDRKVRFTDEAVEIILPGREDSEFELDSVPSSSVGLPATRPLEPKPYGKWVPQKKELSDTLRARKNRSTIARNPFHHHDINMKGIGIENESQYIKSKSITCDLNELKYSRRAYCYQRDRKREKSHFQAGSEAVRQKLGPERRSRGSGR
jgi:hypothetical protein